MDPEMEDIAEVLATAEWHLQQAQTFHDVDTDTALEHLDDCLAQLVVARLGLIAAPRL